MILMIIYGEWPVYKWNESMLLINKRQQLRFSKFIVTLINTEYEQTIIMMLILIFLKYDTIS